MAGTKVTNATAIALIERVPDLSSEDKRQFYRLLKGKEFSNDGTTITWMYDTQKSKNAQFSMPVSVFEEWATIPDTEITDPEIISLLDRLRTGMSDEEKKECYLKLRGTHTRTLNGRLYWDYTSPTQGKISFDVSIEMFNSWADPTSGKDPVRKKVTDPEGLEALKNMRNQMSAAEKRHFYSVLKGKEDRIVEDIIYWVYDLNNGIDDPCTVFMSNTEFEQWATIQDEQPTDETHSASNSNNGETGETIVLSDTATAPGSVPGSKEELTETQQAALKRTYEELKARRLDEGDACSITEPTNVISPCGCHYSTNDVAFVMDTGHFEEISQAYALLADDEKYKTLSDAVQKKIADGTIDLSEEALYERYGINKAQVLQGGQPGASLNPGNKNATAEQINQAAVQNTTFSPTDVMNTNKAPATNSSTVFAEGEFVQWLLENMNERFRKDTKAPMIPTSIGASIAMVRGTNSSAEFGKYNFWKIPYDKSLTSLQKDSEWCAFNTPGDGIQAILQMLHTDRFKGAISSLKEKMWDSTEEDKVSVASSILLLLSGDQSEEHAKKALEYVTKYKMRDWDTDKTEAQGGHADTKANSSNAAKNVESKMGKVVKRVMELLGKKGIGVLVEPIGAEYSRITKLPKGKTPCEPVYPDYITVGDKVPEWIMSETYARLYKEAEEKALKAAGISTKSQEEIDLENVNSEISAFKEQQFAAWCQANGISYTNEEEKEEAKKKYGEASASDSEHFTDGVYTPDESTKNQYLALLREKADIEFNGDTATAAAHIKYLDSIDVATAEIAAREGNWNQDEGHALSLEEQGLAGGNAEFSAIDGSRKDNSGNPGSSGGGSSGNIEAAVSFAESKVGGTYTQNIDSSKGDTRDGPNSYDCSSLVYWALDAGGFGIIDAWKKNARYSASGEVTESSGGYEGKQQVGDADTLWQDIQTMGGTGWTKSSYSSMAGKLQRGDIVTFKSGGYEHHVCFMSDSTKTVEARDTAHGIGQWVLTEAHNDMYEVYRYTSASSGSSEGSSITIIGDSIFVGATPSLKEVFPNADIVAKESMGIDWAYSQVQALSSSGQLGDIVIIEIGTNHGLENNSTQSTANSLLSVIGNQKKVFWCTTYNADAIQFSIDTNNFIKSLPSRYPNVSVIDWYPIPAGDNSILWDNCHCNETGQKKYAQLVKSVVG